MTVDDFIERRVQPEHRDIVAVLRQLMREAAPGTTELITYGIPAWKGRRIVAVLSPTKKDITFSFSHGAAFQDKYALLGGVGKVSKYIKFKSVSEVNQTKLRYYIKQALQFDAVPR